MFRLLTSYLRHIPQLVGLELLLGDGEAFTANLAVVKRVGAKVYFVKGEYGLTSLRSIGEHIPQGMPVMLTIGGKGIIHRVVAGAQDGEVLKQVLPNAKADDFYIQQVDTEENTFLSVARRQLVDHLIGQMVKQGCRFVGAGLGAFSVTQFSQFLFGVEKDSCSFGRHHFTLHNGELIGYELLSADHVRYTGGVNIGGEQLNEQLVVAFATAFSAISDAAQAQLFIPALQTGAEECRQHWLFKRCGVALIAFFFVLLLVNTGFFVYYSDQLADGTGDDVQAIQREIDALRKQASERDALLGGIWHAEAPRWEMAYLADRLAATVPEGILLNDLAVYPKDDALSRKQGRPVHTPSMIWIKGACTDMPLLNGWVKQIRGLLFCESVKIDHYQFDAREGTGIFGLSLTLKP